MYSNKENVNILTALLVAHGVRTAVVCPGSRNAPIVHNLDACPLVACYPVTDERSAGFYALGLAQATGGPVALCVTSGSALLGVLPAVAEACHQHLSLVVISADRPAAWIDQLDGQTLHQPGALEPWVGKSVTLPEPADAVSRWHCNRLVNEALLEAQAEHHPCVHINVPISEPLFGFDVPELPAERMIQRFEPMADYDCLPQLLVDDLLRAERPMVVVGQASPDAFAKGQTGEALYTRAIVIHESLAPFGVPSLIDEVLSAPGVDVESLHPDFVLYVGDAVVSKRLKAFLRQSAVTRVWRVNASGRVEDTFMNLVGIVVGDAEFVVGALGRKLDKFDKPNHRAKSYRQRWLGLLRDARTRAQNYEPPYSQMAAVRLFEEQVAAAANGGLAVHVHYANSSAVRLANIYARRHVWCNRGVNGIEGSLSTAAGFAVGVAPERVFCVIGDLSFFYDQNALWNQNLGGNLRILLLNNGRGGIFDRLPGLAASPALDRLVAGAHSTQAEGCCRQHGVDYLSACCMDELTEGLRHLVCNADAQGPLLLEVFTRSEDDERALDGYRTYRN